MIKEFKEFKELNDGMQVSVTPSKIVYSKADSTKVTEAY